MFKLILNYMPSVIIPTIVSLITTIIFGNFLSPKSYGTYSLFTTTVVIIDACLFYTLSASVLRFYHGYNRENAQNKLVSTYTILTIIVLSILCILGVIIFDDLGFYLVICLAGFVFMNLFSNLLRAQERVISYSLVKVSAPILTLLLIIALIFLNKLTIESAITSYYLPMLIIVIILFYIYIKNKTITFVFSKDIIKESIQFGLPLTVVGLLNILLSSSDRYMIGYYLGNEQVGYYSFSYKIAEILLISFTMAIISALYPQLIKEYESNTPDAVSNLLQRYLNIHLIIMIPFVFIIFLFIDGIVGVLFEQYASATRIIKFTSIGILFLSISYYTNKSFELTKNTRTMVWNLFISAIINIMLNIILIPLMGTMGAVIGTIVSYIAYLLLSLLKSKNILPIKMSIINIIIIGICNIFATLLIIIFPEINIGYSLMNILSEILIFICIYIILIIILVKKNIMKI